MLNLGEVNGYLIHHTFFSSAIKSKIEDYLKQLPCKIITQKDDINKW